MTHHRLSSKMLGMLIYFFTFSAYYIPLTQRIPYLSSIGYTQNQVSIMLAIQAAIGFALQMIFGFLCDKYKTIKQFFYLSAIFGTIGVYWMFNVTQNIFFFHLLSVAVLSSFYNVAVALLDSWTLELDPLMRKSFGSIRAWGTIGWIMSGYLVTLIINHYGYQSLGLTFTIIVLIAMSLAYLLHDAIKEVHLAPLKMKDLNELFSNQRFLILVLALFFVFMLIGLDGLTVVLKMEALGASTAEKYYRFALAALVELPFLFLGARLLKRFNSLHILALGTLVYLFRFILYGLVQTPTLMILASLLQIISFPLVLIATKQLVFDESPKHLRSSGQMVAIACYMGLSGVMSPLISASLIDWVGIDTTLILIGLMMLIPLGLIYRLNQAVSHSHNLT